MVISARSVAFVAGAAARDCVVTDLLGAVLEGSEQVVGDHARYDDRDGGVAVADGTDAHHRLSGPRVTSVMPSSSRSSLCSRSSWYEQSI